ncbi:MAG: hypothetical protein IPL59_05010 [Candidatus Competibacteraceae bacterium]|nr:hypothetical protein [Candidatus Competibacteraceae bacterium]
MRAALNGVAPVAPDGLAGVAAPEWFERYAIRVEEYRLSNEIPPIEFASRIRCALNPYFSLGCVIAAWPAA